MDSACELLLKLNFIYFPSSYTFSVTRVVSVLLSTLSSSFNLVIVRA